jgi:hypothetical protein
MERLIGCENLKGLARVDLQRQGMDVAVDDVFRRYQKRLENLPGGEEAIEEAVRDLARRVRHYKRIIDPAAEEDPHVRAGLSRLRRWGAQTSYPVLMAAYDLRERGLPPVEGLREVVDYIESFLGTAPAGGRPDQRAEQAVRPVRHAAAAGRDVPARPRGRSCPGRAATGRATSSSAKRSGPVRSTTAVAARSEG